ncbi:MAG: hypothetical protein AB1599_01720 [Planctomycetota bacterium]
MRIITIVFIVLAISGLVYGYGFARYDVYNKPASEKGTAAKMTEPDLMDQMCYDGITLDTDGNLLIKEREKACST